MNTNKGLSPSFQPGDRPYRKIQKGRKDPEKCRQKAKEESEREEMPEGHLKKTLNGLKFSWLEEARKALYHSLDFVLFKGD